MDIAVLSLKNVIRAKNKMNYTDSKLAITLLDNE